MKTFDWWSFFAGIASILVGFLLGGYVFLGRIVHETCHGMACLLLGVPVLSLSWDKAVYLTSPNPLVNTFIRLAGGMGQALFSLLFPLVSHSTGERV